MVVKYEIFASDWESWPKHFDHAASFASGVGPERLIGISQSESTAG